VHLVGFIIRTSSDILKCGVPHHFCMVCTCRRRCLWIYLLNNAYRSAWGYQTPSDILQAQSCLVILLHVTSFAAYLLLYFLIMCIT